MSLLSQATDSVQIKPQVYVFYGPNGVGKTTLAASFDKPLIADLEDGAGALKVAKLASEKLSKWSDIESLVAEMLSSNHDFKSLVIDSLDALETILYRHVCEKGEKKNIEDFGYGAGYMQARETMEGLMKKLRGLRDAKKMNIILVGHSAVKAHNDPTQTLPYDRHILRLNAKLAAVIMDLADSVFFITNKMSVYGSGDGKGKATSEGSKIIHTEWSHAFEAKSRFKMPTAIDFTLENVPQVVDQLKPKSEEDMQSEIKMLRGRVKDQALMPKIDQAITDAGNDPAKLQAIKSRLKDLIKV